MSSYTSFNTLLLLPFLACRSFGLSPFCLSPFVCRRFGQDNLSPFWCRRFGVSPFWFVAVLTIPPWVRTYQLMERMGERLDIFIYIYIGTYAQGCTDTSDPRHFGPKTIGTFRVQEMENFRGGKCPEGMSYTLQSTRANQQVQIMMRSLTCVQKTAKCQRLKQIFDQNYPSVQLTKQVDVNR